MEAHLYLQLTKINKFAFFIILQAYSQDAYLRGNEPYARETQNLPEPPPVCYSSSKSPSTSQYHAIPDNMNSGNVAGSQPSPHCLTHHRICSSSSAETTRLLDFHFANHNAAIASASLAHPRKASLPQVRSELCHQALSERYYSQVDQSNLGNSIHYQSNSQERLCELGMAPGGSHGGWTHNTSQDALLLHYSAAMGINHSPCTDSYGLGKTSQISSNSCSENLLAAYASYEQRFGHSLETLEKASILISPHYKKPAWPHEITHLIRVEERTCVANNHKIGSTVLPLSSQLLSQKQQLAAHIRHLPAQSVDDQMVGCHTSIPKTILLQNPSSITPSVAESQEPQGSLVTVFTEEPLQLRQNLHSGIETHHCSLPVDFHKHLSATVLPSQSENSVHKTNSGITPSSVEQDSLAVIPLRGQYIYIFK